MNIISQLRRVSGCSNLSDRSHCTGMKMHDGCSLGWIWQVDDAFYATMRELARKHRVFKTSAIHEWQ